MLRVSTEWSFPDILIFAIGLNITAGYRRVYGFAYLDDWVGSKKNNL